MIQKITATWIVAIVLMLTISIAGTAYYFSVFARGGRTKLVVSTTTSLYDTGLLDTVEEMFEAKYPIDLYFISVGTGLAIRHAEGGDADMILVHDPSRERAFLAGGYGVCRKILAHNFFIIVGPEGDPAEIRGLSPIQTLEKIVDAGRKAEVVWVSRGDDSGTHAKERALWRAADFDWEALRDEDWYREAGAGMGKTLQVANEFSAYTLTDIGTFFKYHKEGLITLVALVDQGKELLNVYSAIAVNPTLHPEANFEAAINLIKFLVSEEGQKIIDEYGQDVYEEKLFHPSVKLLREDTDPIIAGWIREFAYFNGTECPEEYRDGHSELYD
ncbi:MAG: substrate-binding domain-containing protein [Candidatus Bathyarchaeia archaeon]